MIPILILIVSIWLDGVLTNFLPFMVNDLSLFTPLLTLVGIVMIYPFYRKKENHYWITIFITGIIYDLLYTNLLFLNAILFLAVGYLTKIIDKNYGRNAWKIAVSIILQIVIYEFLTGFILFLFQLVPVTFIKIIYKILHSLLGNIIYAELLLAFIHILPKKYKKISIN